MDRLWSFLKNEYRIFITLLYVCLIFGGVFLFANLDMQYFILSLELILFCMLVFLIIEWISYVKREKMSEEIERLQIENNTLRNKIIDERKDLEEYFLLWIHQIKTPITDLSPSNKTVMNGEGYISKDDYSGRNIHFGVREFAMTAITNGILLHGGLKAYCATFFVFSDYTKPMARLSALMNIPTIFVFTHDSIGVGEDGPTHEPIEQLAMLRSLPNFNTFRPADARETIAAWYAAMVSKSTPTAIVLTRQNLPQLDGSGKKALKGAYIIKEASKSTPDMILIASGSEVSLAVEAAKELDKDNISTRVVSMPCMDVFETQSKEYKEEVLPKTVRNRVAIEALSSFGWDRYTGLDGRVISMNSFGASAPQDLLFKRFGFTKENVVATAKEVFNQ